MKLFKRAVLLVGLPVILILSIANYWPIQEIYHPLNTEWNGCSNVANTTQNISLLYSYNESIPRQSILGIIGPNVEFSKKETSEVKSYLEAGGIVLLADDFGIGNSLLEALNVNAKFSRKPLADMLYYDKQPSFPLIMNFLPSPLTVNITVIVLNHPSYIETENSSDVITLASSSLFSFSDLNKNNLPDPDEELTSYPVIVHIKVGEGSLILVSDPSMFTNEMIVLYDNMQLIRNLLKMGRDSLVLDVTHLRKAPLTDMRINLKVATDRIRNYFLFSKNSTYIQSLSAMVLILGCSFQFLKRSRGRRAKT
jgi:hypothetical protein